MKRTSSQIGDELLVLRCQGGDRRALETLIDRWQRRLWSHALRLTASRDGAWEVVQEAWVAVIRGIGRLDDPARFAPWAFRIVTNKAADWVRKTGRGRDLFRELSDESEQPAEPPPAPDNDTSPDDLHAAIDRLPAGQRAALSLHYLEGLGVREVARALAIPPGTVKSRLHHGRETLKRILERRNRRDERSAP